MNYSQSLKIRYSLQTANEILKNPNNASVAADVLEENGLHGNEETLKHLRSGKPVYTAEHEGKLYAYPKEEIHDYIINKYPHRQSTFYDTDHPNQTLTRHVILQGLEGGNHSSDLTSALSSINSATLSTKDAPKNKILIDLSDKLHNKIRSKTANEYQNELDWPFDNKHDWTTHPDQVVNALHEYYTHQYSPSERYLDRDTIRDNVNQFWKIKHDKTPLEKQLPEWERIIDIEHDTQHKRQTRNRRDEY